MINTKMIYYGMIVLLLEKRRSLDTKKDNDARQTFWDNVREI